MALDFLGLGNQFLYNLYYINSFYGSSLAYFCIFLGEAFI